MSFIETLGFIALIALAFYGAWTLMGHLLRWATEQPEPLPPTPMAFEGEETSINSYTDPEDSWHLHIVVTKDVQPGHGDAFRDFRSAFGKFWVALGGEVNMDDRENLWVEPRHTEDDVPVPDPPPEFRPVP